MPHDTRARDVSVLIAGVTGLLSLVAAVILVVSASNIAYTFRVLVTERRAEIALYRAVGASAADVRAWMLALAAVVGVLGGAAGLVTARVAALAADRLAAREAARLPVQAGDLLRVPGVALGRRGSASRRSSRWWARSGRRAGGEGGAGRGPVGELTAALACNANDAAMTER